MSRAADTTQPFGEPPAPAARPAPAGAAASPAARLMEIQLGHMCNNRCVFCVSGQRTGLRQAFPLAGDPIKEKIREGFAEGRRQLTILGGEPTLQPEFLSVLQYAVDLGFEEVVVFTNGVKTARPEFVDEVLATGGNISFRLSFQGGNALAHERTTFKPSPAWCSRSTTSPPAAAAPPSTCAWSAPTTSRSPTCRRCSCPAASARSTSTWSAPSTPASAPTTSCAT